VAAGHQPYVRAAAAVALSEHRVLKSPEVLLEELSYPEPDDLAPALGVALSYFGHNAGVAPLVHGLKTSPLRDNDAAHETYAAALDRIGSDAARHARTTWYRRV
jgi:hypothetical protein